MASASNKILEIVCVLDVTTSMLRTEYDKAPLDILNDQLRIFIDSLKGVPSIVERAELSIITYTENIDELVKYKSLDDIPTTLQLKARKGYTHTAHAVNHAIDMIDQRLAVAGKFKQVTPSILLLITDGNPDQNEDPVYRDRIIRKLNERATSTDTKKKIYPFVIGVGDKFSDQTREILCSYSKDFLDSYIEIKHDQNTEKNFRNLFQLLSNSLRITISGENTFEEVPLTREITAIKGCLQEFLRGYPKSLEEV